MESFSDFGETDSPLSGSSLEPSYFILLPKNIASYSLTSQAILEELRVRHRRLEMHGSAEITPTLFLTLDTIPELLSKQVQLSDSHKSNAAIQEALKELAGLTQHNKEPVVYFYPFILLVDQKLVFRVSMIAPQSKEKTDVVPYRRSCFKYSIDLVDILLKNRSNRDLILEEENPGSRLLRTDQKGRVYFFPTKLSFEAELESILRTSMEPFGPLPTKDFIVDVVTRGKETAKLVEIVPGYHFVLPSGSHHPEYVKHLVVQLDGLKQFAFPYLKRFAKENKYEAFLEKLNDLESKIPTNTEILLKDGYQYVAEISSLLGEFPFEQWNTEDSIRVKNGIQDGILILQKLSKFLSEQKKEDAEDELFSLIQTLSTKIEENTKNTLTLTKLNLQAEIKSLKLSTPLEQKKAMDTIVKTLSDTFGCLEMKEENLHVLFALDQKYLSKVEENTLGLAKTNPDYRNELPILDQIRTILKYRADVSIDKWETEEIAAGDDADLVSENNQSPRFSFSALQEKFHVPVGAFSFLTLAAITTVVSLLLGTLDYIGSGFFFSFCVGLLLGYFYRKDGKPKPNFEKPKQTLPKENRANTITKVAEAFIYPKKFNSIAEKVYDSKRLRNHIEDCVEDIKLELSPADQKKDSHKMIAEIEHAILQISVIIKIPEAIQLKNRSKELILSKADFRTILFRTQLAEYYRKEASLYKSDRDQMDYIQFIIRELEFGYNKYLK